MSDTASTNKPTDPNEAVKLLRRLLEASPCIGDWMFTPSAAMPPAKRDAYARARGDAEDFIKTSLPKTTGEQ